MFPKKCFNGNFKISREVLLACNWVIETDRSKVANRPGIYAIFSSEDGDCLYVGQSQGMRDRLRSSGTWEKAVVECDRPVLYAFETDEPNLRYLECLAIGILRPKWNFTGYVQSTRQTLGLLKPDFLLESEFLRMFEQE
ncbi:MAG: GIY-YIG nuclease family protein, partial [Nostoc sp.]